MHEGINEVCHVLKKQAMHDTAAREQGSPKHSRTGVRRWPGSSRSMSSLSFDKLLARDGGISAETRPKSVSAHKEIEQQEILACLTAQDLEVDKRLQVSVLGLPTH